MLATLTACTTAESPVAGDSGDDGEFSLGPKVTLTFDLSGAITLSGKQTALAPSGGAEFLKSCDEYANRSQYSIAGLLDGDVDGKKVIVELEIEDYKGPGTYPKDQLVAPGSRPSIGVDNKVYGTWPESTSSEVTTDGKGGGTWTFKKLAATAEGGLPGEPVNGTLKWTCKNP
ncbi:hypothetical protein KOI35_22930 [Actinoplanes bogorensis]|uniref:Lipoprotein n=1 Tax=Paractinoplanes bogorensis TaxID=1610840 RepID=A0ABS5YSE3_9ACTN|nr:hypothetical protein [Actinoplanes bogorensis]MBU2666362.1 hypothetical protein [Actinoplanes bogorensis]